jgi:hypothetical protein
VHLGPCGPLKHHGQYHYLDSHNTKITPMSSCSRSSYSSSKHLVHVSAPSSVLGPLFFFNFNTAKPSKMNNRKMGWLNIQGIKRRWSQGLWPSGNRAGQSTGRSPGSEKPRSSSLCPHCGYGHAADSDRLSRQPIVSQFWLARDMSSRRLKSYHDCKACALFFI